VSVITEDVKLGRGKGCGIEKQTHVKFGCVCSAVPGKIDFLTRTMIQDSLRIGEWVRVVSCCIYYYYYYIENKYLYKESSLFRCSALFRVYMPPEKWVFGHLPKPRFHAC